MKNFCPFTRQAMAISPLFVFFGAIVCGPLRAQPEPGRFVTHALDPSMAVPFTPATADPSNLYDRPRSEPVVPPLSLVSDDSTGLLYSRAVNRIADSADWGVETWLATGYGVKCIDHAARVVRHYGRAEGLPGADVAAIHADANGVWCIVRDGASVPPTAARRMSVHLCEWNRRTGRWTDRSTFLLSYQDYLNGARSPNDVRCLLAVSDRYVAVVGGTISNTDNRFAAIRDRRTGQMTDLPWEPGLRVDSGVVVPTTLSLDARGAWIGTDHGLLRWHFADRKCRRLLPDCCIDCAASDGVGSLWVADHARSQPSDQPASVPPEWCLSRIAAKTEAIDSWIPPELSTLKASDSRRPSFAVLGRDKDWDLRQTIPAGLYVDLDGAVWTTLRAPTPSLPGVAGAPAGSGWMRFEPVGCNWRSYVVHAVPPRAPYYGRTVPTDEIYSSTETEPQPIPFSAIPTGAVRSMALRASRPLLSFDSPNTLSSDTELFWQLRRFPEWLCRDAYDSPTTGTSTSVPAAAIPPCTPDWQRDLGRMPDLEDPGKVWIVNLAGDSISRCPPASVPQPILESRRTGITHSNDRELAPPEAPNISQTWWLSVIRGTSDTSAVTATDTPGIQGLVSIVDRGAHSAASSESQPRLIVGTSHGLFGLNTTTNTLTPLYSAGSVVNFRHAIGSGITAERTSDGLDLVSVERTPDGSRVVRWDPLRPAQATRAEPEVTTQSAGILAENPADGGIWLREFSGIGPGASGPRTETATYIPGRVRRGATRDGVVCVVAPPAVATGLRSKWLLIGATGAIAWWAPTGGQPAMVKGYDAVHQRWVADVPAAIFDPVAMDFTRMDSAGSLYVVGQNVDGTALWRYDDTADRWDPVAPLPPLPSAANPSPAGQLPRYAGQQQLQLIAVTPAMALMAAYDGRLFRYDRRINQWDPPVSLPTSLRRQISFLDRSMALVDDVVYVGSQDGLYQLPLDATADDHLPVAANWTEVKSILALTTRPVTTPYSSSPPLWITAIQPERRYIYALLSGERTRRGARLDRQTGQWSIYDDSRGFPTRGINVRLVGDGAEGAWLTEGSGDVYRFDGPTDRWQQVFAHYTRPAPTLDVTSAPSRSMPALPEIFGNPKIVANGTESDILVQESSDAAGGHYNDIVELWRFANTDGKLIARLRCPNPVHPFSTAMATAANGDIWVGIDKQYYRVHLSGATAAEQWRPVVFPIDLLGWVNGFDTEPNGGLWISTFDEAYLWQAPRK